MDKLLISEKEIIDLYTNAEMVGYYDKIEIIKLIVSYYQKKYGITDTGNDWPHLIPTIIRVVNKYVASTYEEIPYEAFDDAMSII